MQYVKVKDSALISDRLLDYLRKLHILSASYGNISADSHFI